MPHPIQKNFGLRIVELRARHGWSQEQLAARVDLSTQYISGIENGRRNPGLVVIAKLAHGFGMDASDLLRGVLSNAPSNDE